MELAPQPHILLYSDEKKSMDQLVNLSDDKKILFEYTAGANGLMLDFETGVATLRSSPDASKRHANGYINQPFTQFGRSVRKKSMAQDWESWMEMSKIEVYSAGPVPDRYELENGWWRSTS